MAETHWAAWLRHAVVSLGLRPADFWALSLKEWRMLNPSARSETLSRNEFETLRQQFPDGGPT
jgi:hypothetical protein